jgi:hypothetical protein
MLRQPTKAHAAAMETLILQQFGKAGNIAALFASTLGLFVFIEKMSSTRARADFTNYLKSTDFAGAVVNLPYDTRALFERVFGTRHFSLRCVSASVLFSIAGVAGAYGFLILNNPAYLRFAQEPRFAASFGAWATWSLVPDYLNLLKTRVALNIITARQIKRTSVLIGILFADLFFGYVIFSLTFWPIFMFGMDVEEYGLITALQMRYYHFLLSGLWYDVLQSVRWVWSGLFSAMNLVLFLPGMVPSIWLWLYVAATLIVRLALRSSSWLRFLLYLFDIDKHPIRSVGIVAAMLVSGAYAVVLAISKFAQVVS